MSTIELKDNIHELIDQVENDQVLQGIYFILTANVSGKQAKNPWDELPEHVKEGIKEGLAQSERGETTPHEEFMKEIDEKLKVA